MYRACFLVVVVAFQVFSLVASQENNDVLDSFKVFENFPFGVAITDNDNDTIFECVTAKRAWLDMDSKKVEYVWLLKGPKGTPRKTIAFYAAEGNSPDTFLFMEGSDDAPPVVGKLYYSDYKTCAVIDMSHQSPRCILWATETSKDSLPQECLDQFEKNCGVGIPVYTKDLCADSEVANW
ncbi:uncharacterized protein LOC125947365 [Dermacentor silvarum]|uniref:uncharacterized protein LOC125947365 n=1 Tax=Dermacentor silvarum TaxID=543639 RepID=UPI002101662F|nr:uncharacterized protein LOC125947365 [Dermacentor silvarum]